jgi:hypothetical protein
MSSEVQICNLALVRLGERSITALDEGTKAANLCALYFNPIRDEVLAAHSWGFAGKRRNLALLSTDATGRWSYAYQMPSDCLRPRFVESPNGNRDTAYRIEGTVFLTNVSPCTLVYTCRIEDPNRFSTDFTKALWTRLASELAIPLSGSKTLNQQMWGLHIAAMVEASAEDASTDRDEADCQLDPWLAARR